MFKLKKTLIILLFSLLLYQGLAAQKVTVEVDPKYELFTTIQYLAGYPVLNISKLPYKKKIDNYFAQFRGDTAVKLYGYVGGQYMSFSRPYNYLLHFDYPNYKASSFPLLDSIAAEDKYYKKIADTMPVFMNALRNFYLKTNYQSFFNSNNAYYKKLVKKVKRLVRAYNYFSLQENYYGKKFKAYHVKISPLIHSGGFGMTYKNEAFAFFGPYTSSLADTSKQSEDFPSTYVEEMILHELGHSFANPVILNNYVSFKDLDYLAIPIQKQMKTQGNGTDWKDYLCEHLVRAVVIRLTDKLHGHTESQKMLANELGKGYLYLNQFVSALEIYESNRKEYKNLNDFVPILIKYLEQR